MKCKCSHDRHDHHAGKGFCQVFIGGAFCPCGYFSSSESQQISCSGGLGCCKIREVDYKKHSFVIPGEPKPQPRVKAFSRGRHAGVYYPKGEWQGWANRIFLCCVGAPKPAPEGPIKLTMRFLMPIPKSLPKKYRDGSCPKRPDIDNMAKLVMDVLQKRGWFRDDGQVVWLDANKVYGNEPGLELEIELR